ncbi:MAG: hypothetical protein ABEI52_09665 [Halobacteriaceae archaeon]
MNYTEFAHQALLIFTTAWVLYGLYYLATRRTDMFITVGVVLLIAWTFREYQARFA